MKDDFNLYEWKDSLRTNMQEQSMTGRQASTRVIEFLRKSIYPKLSEGEDLEEETLDTAGTIKLDDLTYDVIEDVFGGKVNLPLPIDSSASIVDEEGLKRWSDRIRSKYGNVDVKLDNTTQSPYDRVTVLDDQFVQDEMEYRDMKSASLKGMSKD